MLTSLLLIQHIHSAGVIERVRWVKQNFPQVQVIGGNIATGDAALALLDAGADAVKVGITWFYLYYTYCGWYRYATNFCN